MRLLWVDGTLEEERIVRLRTYLRVIEVRQSVSYCVITFTGRADGMTLRSYLDPNVFVLQCNDSCTTLEINFNPTPTQVEALRRIYQAMALRRIS